MITLNGLGWQTAVQQYNRTGAEQPLAAVLLMRLPVAPATATPQQNGQSSTSGQNAEDARKEAFAKLMVMLQNPDVAARQQAASTSRTPAVPWRRSATTWPNHRKRRSGRSTSPSWA